MKLYKSTVRVQSLVDDQKGMDDVLDLIEDSLRYRHFVVVAHLTWTPESESRHSRQRVMTHVQHDPTLVNVCCLH